MATPVSSASSSLGEAGLRAPGRASSERAVLITVALGSMLAPLNSTMIAVALPALLSDLGRSLAWGAWIVTSYLVTMAVAQPLAGSLGDRYGRRRLFILGLVAFLGTSLLAALAPTIEVLILARTGQAVAGAVAFPNGTALVRSLIGEERRGRAFGSIGAGVAVAAGLGPPIGGVLTDALGWRWIFAANLLLLVPALLLARRLPTEQRIPHAGRFDLPGAALLTGALVALVLALTIWRLPGVPVWSAPLLALVGALWAALLLRRSFRAGSGVAPVLNLSLFRRSGFTAATLAVLLSNLTMYTVLLSLPVFLTERGHWSSSRVGLLLAALSLQTSVISPVGGWLADRYGRRLPAVCGAGLMVVGMAPLLRMAADWSWVHYVGPLTLIGVGLGLLTPAILATAIEAAPAGEAGQASGLYSTMRYLGSILGAAGMAAILGDAAPSVASIRLLYALLGLAAGLAVLSAARLPGLLARRAESATH